VGESLSRLNLALGAQRGGLLLSFRIAAAITACPEDNRYSLLFVEYGSRQVSSNLRFVIRMRNHQQQVCFEARVRRRIP
jgi:hypothetical protein